MEKINLKALLFELVFDKNKEGVSAISIVGAPAILTNFVKFGEDTPDIKIVMANEEQRIIAGPIIIPNIKIFRSGKSLGMDSDAYVFFREETIRALQEDYNAKLKIHNSTIEHKEETDDVRMMENWIVEDSQKDKSSLYGFDLPKGSWFGMFRVLSDSLWEQIKSGDLKGFSIEAALGLVAKGEVSMGRFSEEEADEREVIPNDLKPLILKHLSMVGCTEDLMPRFGFMKVSEDGQLTKEGEALALYFAVESEPTEKSALDQGLYAIRYKYVGPRDEKNRDFCAEVLDKDLIYRKEDIDMMSFRGENPMSSQNYSIFRYKGSYNCRHRWIKQVYFAADWEEALNNLEKYIAYLTDVIAYGDSLDKPGPMITGAIDILQKQLDTIKKELEDFEKTGPFTKGLPSKPITSNIPDLPVPEYEDEATKVNAKVVKMASEEDIEELIKKIQTDLMGSFKQMAEFSKKLKEAYEETKEDVFKKALDEMDKGTEKIYDSLNDAVNTLLK